jgi:hypothetical protein
VSSTGRERNIDNKIERENNFERARRKFLGRNGARNKINLLKLIVVR